MQSITINIENFLQIKNSEVHLTPSPTFIFGENLDSLNKSNGAGKTLFLESIFFCLYGESLRGISLSDLIGPHAPHVEVRLRVEGVGGYDVVSITRRRTATVSTLKLWLNDVEQKFQKIEYAQDKINSIVGLDKNQAKRSMYYGEASEHILDQTPSERTEAILSLISYDKDTHKKIHEFCGRSIKKTEAEYNKQQGVLDSIEEIFAEKANTELSLLKLLEEKSEESGVTLQKAIDDFIEKYDDRFSVAEGQENTMKLAASVHETSCEFWNNELNKLRKKSEEISEQKAEIKSEFDSLKSNQKEIKSKLEKIESDHKQTVKDFVGRLIPLSGFQSRKIEAVNKWKEESNKKVEESGLSEALEELDFELDCLIRLSKEEGDLYNDIQKVKEDYKNKIKSIQNEEEVVCDSCGQIVGKNEVDHISKKYEEKITQIKNAYTQKESEVMDKLEQVRNSMSRAKEIILLVDGENSGFILSSYCDLSVDKILFKIKSKCKKADLEFEVELENHPSNLDDVLEKTKQDFEEEFNKSVDDALIEFVSRFEGLIKSKIDQEKYDGIGDFIKEKLYSPINYESNFKWLLDKRRANLFSEEEEMESKIKSCLIKAKEHKALGEENQKLIGEYNEVIQEEKNSFKKLEMLKENFKKSQNELKSKNKELKIRLKEIEKEKKNKINEISSKCQTMKTEIAFYKLMRENLGVYRKYRINKFVQKLEGQVNEYLSQINSDIVCSIEISDKNEDIEIMFTDSSKYGNFLPFKVFSKGERTRIKKIFFQLFVEIFNPFIILSDESYDGLDPTGIKAIAGFSASMNAHRAYLEATPLDLDTVLSIEDSLMVRKQGGTITISKNV